MLLPIRRTLVQALIVSLLIHLVLLLGVAVLPPVQPEAASTTINVVVSREARRVSPEQAANIPSENPVVAPAKLSSSTPRKAPEQPIVTVDQSTAAPVASALPAIQEAGVSAHAVPAAEEKSGAASAPASPLASTPVREGLSTDEMTELRFALSKAAKRFKIYPPLARERGWEGTVDVALIFTARSSAPGVSLVHSSGRAILDEQAMDMAARAARATVLPAGLTGRDFQVPLSIKFSLEDD